MNPDGTEPDGVLRQQLVSGRTRSSTPARSPIIRPRSWRVISGHHGVPRMGELVLFDPAQGRREADGVVQRIPGHGQKVEPVIADGLVEGSWPKFLHPYPLSDKYFLVSCKPTPQSEWGIYLVDVFDNLVLLREEPGYALVRAGAAAARRPSRRSFPTRST